MELLEEFTSVIDALSSSHIEYAVCGGIALAIHGHARATRDIDLLLLQSDLDSALAAVGRAGYTLEGGLLVFGAGTARERRLFRVSRASGPDLMTLDLLLVVDPNDPIWVDREPIRWRDRDLVVVSRAGLVAMKRSAGRLQDLADVERLLGSDEPGSP